MRILFLTMGYPSKVNPRRIVFLKRLVDELVDQGHDCTVISPIRVPCERIQPNKKEKQTTKNGHSVQVYFPKYICAWLKSRLKFDLIELVSVKNYIQAVKRVVKENNLKFDCVYSHFLGISAMAAVELGNEYGVPVFAAAGESKFTVFEGYDAARAREYLNKLDGIISVSSENKKLLLENGILDDERIGVFPNGIDSDCFFPRGMQSARKKFGLPCDAFIVAFTGHFIERKGPLRVSEATIRSGVNVIYAGSGSQEPSKENSLFCSIVSPDDMPWFLSAANVFILPTLNEGCCNAIIEALACGLPVISSNLPFNDDILDDSCSIRVDPSDINALVDAINKVHNNPKYAQALSKAAEIKGRELSLSKRAEMIIKWIERRI